MEKLYDQASDIWALGCTFLELYTCHETLSMRPEKRKPFLMGTSCYPLSPGEKIEESAEASVEDSDQLMVILRSMGRCNEQDMSFISDSKARKYFTMLNTEAPCKQTASLHGFLELDDPTITELLKPMLQVNPYLRPTAKELLKCRYFDDVRISKYENPSLVKLTLEIDSDDLKDPDNTHSTLTT